MCILISVVEGAGRLFGIGWMSSNDDRISSVQCRIVRWYSTDRAYFDALSIDVRGAPVSVSTQDGLRSVGDHGRPVLPAAETARRRHHLTPVAGPATLTTAAPEREELRDGYP